MRVLAGNFVINISEERTIKGQVICARNGVFQVECDNEILELRARGKLKLFKKEILTGDYIEVSKGTIVNVYPRSSRFDRPKVANIEYLIIVLCDKPNADYLILDKLLLSAAYADVECAVVVNKIDIGHKTLDYLKSEYPFVENLFAVSASKNIGIEALKNFLKGKLVGVAGQSAVGKTTLINCLTGSRYSTGDLSTKTQRGKHTTTFSKIIRTDDFSVVDTPGFSELYADVKPEDVANSFQPYDEFIGKCRFSDCTHINEPDCAVKKAVEQGHLSKERYERYKIIYNEILSEHKKQYD